MRNEFVQDACLADIESSVINAQRDLQGIQDRLTDALTMIQRLLLKDEQRRASKKPKGRKKPLNRQSKDPRREQILDALAAGEHTITAIAVQFNTSQRSIRRVIDRAKAEGDPRVANRGKRIVPADSSQSVSRSLGKDAPDPEAGTIGEPATAVYPGQQYGQSGEESTEDTAEGVTEAAQAGNEAGTDATGTHTAEETVPAETDEEDCAPAHQDASSSALETFQSLGDIAKRIVERRKLKRVQVEEPLGFVPPIETTVVGVDMGNGADVTIHAVYSRGKGFQPITDEVVLTPLNEAKIRHSVALEPGEISVDLEPNTVTSTAGVQQVDKPFAKVLNHMKDGGLYPLDILAETAGYRTKEQVKENLRAWRPKLEQIGVDVVAMTKHFDLVQLRRLGA